MKTKGSLNDGASENGSVWCLLPTNDTNLEGLNTTTDLPMEQRQDGQLRIREPFIMAELRSQQASGGPPRRSLALLPTNIPSWDNSFETTRNILPYGCDDRESPIRPVQADISTTTSNSLMPRRACPRGDSE
jgi:hypothetical protein